MKQIRLINGNSQEELKTLYDNSIDSIVTDPPYGLSFMGKKWDYDVPSKELWIEVLRVLKPGGHLLSFAGSRTYHRMAVNIEDAGFEIRDQIMWVYGSGFPKSLNIGKKIDGYEGWGTALKPAHEPIVVARKPISEKTVAQNTLKWGTGGINIDASRVGTDDDIAKKYPNGPGGKTFGGSDMKMNKWKQPLGRFPANFIHDGSDEVVELFPSSKGQQGNVKGTEPSSPTNGIYGDFKGRPPAEKRNDSGSAARFFYCAKAGKSERNKGLTKNDHPTVKPIKLMQYLVKLVTPTNGTVLDPFNGSGTTGIACKLEDFNYIGIELDPEYIKISEARIAAHEKELKLL